MSIRAIAESVYQYVPSNPLSGRFSLNLPQIASNLNKVAVPAIALYAFSNVPTALAGPIAYSACVAGCTVFSGMIGLPVCVGGCLPFLAAPTP